MKLDIKVIHNMSWGSITFDMTSEGFGKIFEGDFADICADKSLFILMRIQATTSSMNRWGAKTTLIVIKNSLCNLILTTKN